MDQKIMQRVDEMFKEANIPLDSDTRIFLELAGRYPVDTNPGWAIATASIFASRINECALQEHAEAIIKSAEASEKHASSLSRAIGL